MLKLTIKRPFQMQTRALQFNDLTTLYSSECGLWSNDIQYHILVRLSLIVKQ